MRCDMCPLCPIAEDDACPIADDPKYGIEHEEGMSGCRHPYNWAKKKSDEYADYLGKMGEGIARMIEEERMQDALEKLQARLICDELSLENHCNGEECDNCEYNYAQGNMGERKNALRTAIGVIEKQIPIKPKKSDCQDVRYVTKYECPICHKTFLERGLSNYCCRCGQRLEWD